MHIITAQEKNYGIKFSNNSIKRVNIYVLMNFYFTSDEIFVNLILTNLLDNTVLSPL